MFRIDGAKIKKKSELYYSLQKKCNTNSMMYYKNPEFSVAPDIGCIIHGNRNT